MIIYQIKLNKNNILSFKETSKDKEGDSLLQNGRLDNEISRLPINSKKTASTNIKQIYIINNIEINYIK